MKKFFSIIIFLTIIILGFFLIILSTKGIQTKKFNNIITQKIKQSNKNINIEFNLIRFKLDIKELSLFLETNNPLIYYRDAAIPTNKIKVYVEFFSILKNDTKIEKILLSFKEIEIDQLKKISFSFKPSNFKSFLNNNIKEGILDAGIEVYFEDNSVQNFIARGSAKNLSIRITDNINLNKTNFSFFADKSDILVKNFLSESNLFNIKDGDLKIKFAPELSLSSNFKSEFSYDSKLKNFKNSIKKINILKNLTYLKGLSNNSLNISFDTTYKIKNYDFKSNGKISKANIIFDKPFDNFLSKNKFEQISFENSQIKINFNSKNNNTSVTGNYLIPNSKPMPFNIKNISIGENFKTDLEFDYLDKIELNLINYEKPKNTISKISLAANKTKQKITINNFVLKESKNLVSFKNLILNKGKIISIQNIKVKTSQNDKKNNDFMLEFGKKILIKGSKLDATNLPKILKQKNNNKSFSKINKEIEIDLNTVIAPLSENLKNFKLIGTIQNGKFVKISSKGSFGGGNFLDISMKNDEKNKKKYLEIYSDITRPLLTEYNFFKGLKDGKLLFSSVIGESSTNSKLKIEDFKVVNAPGMIKLLSLADLGGLADLAAGEGISFDILEIKMEKTQDTLKLNEILAIGPSISVLMEGYQDSNLTSLRGTLIPAKTLNKMISRIPVIGNIVIPKEVGEGLFGISFKMKGPPGKLKTTINPIRTITPRFIQKIIDKNKKTK